MNRRRAVVVASLLGAFAACRTHEGPADPVWGKEPCAQCAMVVSDKRYAAQILTDDGSRHYFDDIGCMIVFVSERRIHPKAWVRDESKGTWLDAESARYRDGLRTPMDYGFAAATDGTISFGDVRRAVLARRESHR